MASTSLPPGAIVPSLTGHNVLQSGAVVQAVRGLIEQIGGRQRRVALAIPDTAAKVSLLPFEHIPANPRDLEQLIRLQLRKTVPFPVEDAQVAWSRGGVQDGATTLVVQSAPKTRPGGTCAYSGSRGRVNVPVTYGSVELAAYDLRRGKLKRRVTVHGSGSRCPIVHMTYGGSAGTISHAPTTAQLEAAIAKLSK